MSRTKETDILVRRSTTCGVSRVSGVGREVSSGFIVWCRCRTGRPGRGVSRMQMHGTAADVNVSRAGNAAAGWCGRGAASPGSSRSVRCPEAPGPSQASAASSHVLLPAEVSVVCRLYEKHAFPRR